MSPDASYFENSTEFQLFTSSTSPAWRRPQLGALGALLKHWSLPDAEPALISLPTGTGKTAVAIAAAHVAQAKRVLVVVPSTELRRQLAQAFESQDVLKRIGALPDGGASPHVMIVQGHVEDWSTLEHADVVVALPNSISPVHYESNPPPRDLFELLVIDEAHHAPARTWRAILDYFEFKRAVLLTATPRRRDGQQLPGHHAYHYPLRQALEDHVYKTVEPLLLDVNGSMDKTAIDGIILAEAQRQLNLDEHASSTLLIRAASRERATQLSKRYTDSGIPTRVLHSGLGKPAQQRIVNDLRAGQLRAVAVVGMLIEGFDLPSLRIVAYHDKHKSLLATAQLIGRLARVDSEFPQPSLLVTARDVDVFPELRGVVRTLYEEDADWTEVLPGIIDDEVARQVADREYTQSFNEPPPPSLSLEAVHPLRRAVVFEVPPGSGWSPEFVEGIMPAGLGTGQHVRGQTVLYAGLSPDARTLMLVTTSIARPRWHDAAGLDSRSYELHVISFRQSAQAHLPSLLLFNSSNRAMINEVISILNASDALESADPSRLQEGFDSLDRVSVSSVGVRNTYASRGIPAYRMYAGSGVDRGLREADTSFGALGHAMIQVADQGGAFTAGIATSKGKYWETRYVSLREYEEFITNFAERYWFPPAAPLGRLLPQVQRGRRLSSWPDHDVLAVELDYALLGGGWEVAGVGALELLDFYAHVDGGAAERLILEARASHQVDEPVVWVGELDLLGNVNAVGADLSVRRGFAGTVPLSELLTARPPTVFFVDGTTVQGLSLVDSRAATRDLPDALMQVHDWTGVDTRAETRVKALERGVGSSIHEALETLLIQRVATARHGWVLCNDGAGEFADYITITVDKAGRVGLGLWHAKFAGGDPSVRVGDMQEVVAQAIKSRRWITDVGFWERLGARLTGRDSPAALVMYGNRRLLEVLCGETDRWAELSYRKRRPVVSGQIAIVQPGLSEAQLLTELQAPARLSATQVRDLLAVFVDAVAFQAPNPIVLCSA